MTAEIVIGFLLTIVTGLIISAITRMAKLNNIVVGVEEWRKEYSQITRELSQHYATLSVRLQQLETMLTGLRELSTLDREQRREDIQRIEKAIETIGRSLEKQ